MKEVTLNSGNVIEIEKNLSENRLYVYFKHFAVPVSEKDFQEISEITTELGEPIEVEAMKYCYKGHRYDCKSYYLQKNGEQVFAPCGCNKLYFAVSSKVVGEGTFFA